MPTNSDRAALLRDNASDFTGIDFVETVFDTDPTNPPKLRAFFLTDARLVFQSGDLEPQDIVIANATDVNAPGLEVTSVTGPDVDTESGRVFLELGLEQDGGFADYRLKINDPNPPAAGPRVDLFFNDVQFSFKAGCLDEDCATPPVECPVEPQQDFPIDYLARDFTSFRNALLDFAAQRFPEYTLPVEADVGVMLAEVMAALGDEFSYIQDRYAREAYLETATQRRSLRKKARLLDFEIHDGRSPSTLLELKVDAGTSSEIDAGTRVWVGSEGGEPIAFEVGLGLRDERKFPVREVWNASDAAAPGGLEPYCLDDSQTCLQVGATELFIKGSLADNGLDIETDGLVMLLRIDPEDPGVPARRHFVRLLDPEELVDRLNPDGPQTITRIVWADDDALPFQLDQQELQLSLNIVPATAGETVTQKFIVGVEQSPDEDTELATERQGPLFANTTTRPAVFLYGLPRTGEEGLGFLGQALRDSLPEITLESELDGATDTWNFQRSLVGAPPNRPVFTLEDGTWQRIIAFQREGEEVVHRDYASGSGYSVRFGDGEFGQIPARGSVFTATYRLGPGSRGNVPAGAVSRLQTPPGRKATEAEDMAREMPGFVVEASNPVEVVDGADPESARDIKLLTPEAFRADVLFAVRPEDYRTQAQKLSFIQRAHGTPRWTGSWTSMFVAGDPRGAFTLAEEQTNQLEDWLDCVRQTGRDVIVRSAKSLILDLRIVVCVEPFAYGANVRSQIEQLLTGSGGGRDQRPFFDPDNFTFGMPLRRSALEEVVQRVPGVSFIRRIEVHERGRRAPYPFTSALLRVEPDEVIRLDNNPLRPGNGTLTIETQGGA